MDHEPYHWQASAAGWDSSPSNSGGGDAEASFEFEEDPGSTSQSPRSVARIVRRMIPLLVLSAALLVVASQPNLALLLQRSRTGAPVQITVVCDVPWATIRVDGRGNEAPCSHGIAGTLPMAHFSVSSGAHTLLATAEGFAPYPIYIVVHPDTSGLYLTQFALTPEGTAQILDAVNAFLASTYTQDVIFPATLWQTLGLRAPPSGSTLVVRERFEATALDTYEPFYSETTYQRPITPEPGTVGVAVVVVEQVTVYGDCGTTPLLERRTPVLYATRASVTLSARPGRDHWIVTKPYTLNPIADIYTAPNLAATPMTPAGLLTLAARTELANRLGDLGLLAGALTATPLTTTTTWAAGIVLTLANSGPQAPHVTGAHAGAAWVYTGGELLALNAAAQALSPGIPATLPSGGLDALRSSLASQPTRICGGE